MDKKNNVLVVLVIILSILVLALGGYLIYDKVLNNNDINNENESENQNQNEENNNYISANDNQNNNVSNYNNWMDYIINSNINSIELNYCIDNTSDNQDIPSKKAINITNNDLSKIFEEMKKGTIAKNYYGGLGGPCMSSININYTSNENTYELNLILYKYIDVEFLKDQKILSYLENTEYTIKKYSENIDLTNEPYMFEYTYDETIIDEIINN